MKEKRLCIHYYGEEKNKKALILAISDVLLCKEYDDIKWYMKRDWRHGPHIEIYVHPKRGNKKVEKCFLERIIERTHVFWSKENTIEVLPKEEVLDQLNMMEYGEETSKESYLPIEKNYTCRIEDVETTPGKMYSLQTEFNYYQKKRIECSRLIMETIRVLSGLDEKNQYLLLVALFGKVAECYPRLGLKRGCISFKSHVIGFLANPDKRTASIGRTFDKVFDELHDDLVAIYANQFVIKEYETLLNAWFDFNKKFIRNIKYDNQMHEQFLVDGRMMKESEKNLSQISDFHNKWVSREGFQEFFYSKSFYKYRLLVNFFYLMLPNMGVGPIGKHLTCYLITKTIEETDHVEFVDFISAEKE